jgi:copper chaperone
MNQQFQVQGMSCQHCAQSVQGAVWDVDPQAEVTVDLPSGQVAVQSQQPRQRLADAITGAGYKVQA